MRFQCKFLSMLSAMLCLMVFAAPPVRADDKAEPKTHTVTAGPVEMVLELDGQGAALEFEPIQYQAKVLKELKIKKVVAHGQLVRRGDVLIEPDTEKLKDDLAQRKLAVVLGKVELKLAELKLAQAEQTQPRQLEKARIAMERAAADLKRFLSSGKALARAAAEESLQTAKDRVTYAREELKQLMKMYKADDLTEETEEIILQRTKDDLRRAEQMLLQTAEKSHFQLEQGIARQEVDTRHAAEDAELALRHMKQTAELTLEEKRLAVQQKRITQGKAERDLKDAQADLAAQTIKAPRDGVVYYGDFDQHGRWKGAGNLAAMKPGTTLAADQVVMTVFSDKPMGVAVTIPEKHLHRVTKKPAVQVIPTAYPRRRLPGELDTFSAKPEADGTFTGSITLTADADLLLPGMTGKVELVVHRAKSAMAVPDQAVRYGDPGWYVRVQTDSGAKRRTVELGPTLDGRTVITQGLKAGEVILLETP